MKYTLRTCRKNDPCPYYSLEISPTYRKVWKTDCRTADHWSDGAFKKKSVLLDCFYIISISFDVQHERQKYFRDYLENTKSVLLFDTPFHLSRRIQSLQLAGRKRVSMQLTNYENFEKVKMDLSEIMTHEYHQNFMNLYEVNLPISFFIHQN